MLLGRYYYGPVLWEEGRSMTFEINIVLKIEPAGHIPSLIFRPLVYVIFSVILIHIDYRLYTRFFAPIYE